MNKAFLIGNLTRDPELSETTGGKSICKFGLAVKKGYGSEEAYYFNIVAWGNLAESVAKYTSKGQKVAVSGSIDLQSWTDDEGKTHRACEIVANEVEYLTSKSQMESKSTQSQPQQQFQIEHDSKVPGHFKDEDIPF